MKTRANYTDEQLELRRKIRKEARLKAKKILKNHNFKYPGWVVEEMTEFTYKFLTEHGKENME